MKHSLRGRPPLSEDAATQYPLSKLPRRGPIASSPVVAEWVSGLAQRIEESMGGTPHRVQLYGYRYKGAEFLRLRFDTPYLSPYHFVIEISGDYCLDDAATLVPDAPEAIHLAGLLAAHFNLDLTIVT
jgi:hypothetical protein